MNDSQHTNRNSESAISRGGGAVWQFVSRISGNPRTRNEILWVALVKGIDLPLTFVSLKLFTNLMSREVWAQYSLAITGLLLIANIVIMPAHQAYRREFHGLLQAGRLREATRLLFIWYAVGVTLVAVGAQFAGAVLHEPLGIEAGVIPAAGLIFAGNRWRVMGVDLLEVRRDRRGVALHFLSFRIAQIAAVALVAWRVSDSATAALLTEAACSAIFGAWVMWSFMKWLRTTPDNLNPADQQEVRTEFRRSTLQFGAPFAALLTMSWLQTFADRFVVGARITLAEAGTYAAAFTLTGVPYILALQLLHQLLVPIVYQRAHRVDSDNGLWAADRLLIASWCIFVTVGLVTLPIYTLFGPGLLRLLTTSEYAMSASTLTILACGRFLGQLTTLVEITFAVHRRMGPTLAYRTTSAVIMLVLLWWWTGAYGAPGAAWAMLAGSVIYLVGIGAGPGGALGMIRKSRREGSVRSDA